MQAARQASIGPFDLDHFHSRRNPQGAPCTRRSGRRRPRLCALTRTPPAVQKGVRPRSAIRGGAVDAAGRPSCEGAARWTIRHAEAHASIGQLLKRLEPEEQLASEGVADDRGRYLKLRNEHIAVQALGRQRAQQRETQDCVVRSAVAAQEFSERGVLAVELDGDDKSLGKKDAVHASTILYEFERACGLAPIKSAQKVSQGGRPQAT